MDLAPAGRNFREETITDLLTGAFAGLAGLGLEVDLPREDLTGADMEWWFVNTRTGGRLRVLIQAKRATLAKTWKGARFSELAHPNNTGAQSQTLLDEARRSPYPTVALYAFYCSQTLLNQANAEGGQRLTGVDFADAVFVRTLIGKDLVGKRISLAAGKSRYGWPNRKLKVLRPRFFSLHDLLCIRRPLVAYVGSRRTSTAYFLVTSPVSRPTTITSPHIPEPEEILKKLAALGVELASTSVETAERVDAPTASTEALPAYVSRLLGGETETLAEAGVEPFGRRLVVFRSGGEAILASTDEGVDVRQMPPRARD